MLFFSPRKGRKSYDGSSGASQKLLLHPAPAVDRQLSLASAPPELLMVLGVLVMTCANTFVQAWKISLLELIAGRFALQWVICFFALLLRSAFTKQPFRPFGPPETRHWLILHCVLYYAFIWVWWATLRQVPQGNAVTVVRFQCFIAGVASHFLFSEHLTIRWWTCALTAFAGVILITQPPVLFGNATVEGDTRGYTNLSIFFNLLSALGSAAMGLSIKMVHNTHFFEVQHMRDFVCGVICSPPLLFWFGHPSKLLVPAVQLDILVIAVIAIAGTCLVTAAYQHGSTGRMSLMTYVEIPSSYIVQVVVFGEKLDTLGWCGAVMIVGAAVLVALQRPK